MTSHTHASAHTVPKPHQNKSHAKLGQLAATAICGNDILSSALYVSGIAILFAGIYAPVVLLGVVGVLYLYKKVYTEVVEALPINGGAYNCLLNGTSKTVAAVAGVMTFLSYIATAVISAKVGAEYLGKIAHFDAWIATYQLPMGFEVTPVMLVSMCVLFFFALLVISGVKDSATVAVSIFLFHIVTLTAFLVFGLIHFLFGEAQFLAENATHTVDLVSTNHGLWKTLFLAFSASLLGVSGFESSANFVEEQGKGVFRKTLRNMLIGVAVFNPLIALIVLQSMPYEAIASAKDFLLADAAYSMQGSWFQFLVVVDAFLVLSGAVLTSFVGVSGLMHRMSMDMCIPHYFSKENRKGSFPRIIWGFFILCSSILIITHGDLLSLAGVYTIAFLGVMSLFALGNLVLKESREDLKRTYQAPFFAVLLAFLATSFGIVGNIYLDPNNLRFFALYFIPSVVLVLCVIYIDKIFKVFLRLTRSFPHFNQYVRLHFKDLTDGTFVAFIHHVSRLQLILDYIDRNETGWNITLVHCIDGTEESKANAKIIQDLLPKIQDAGFYPHFKIQLLIKKKTFSPALIDEISTELHIEKNRIFIGSIHKTHDFDYAELGGARIIFG